MPTVAEASKHGQSQLNAALKQGLDVIDRLQTVTFTKYVRLILPLDGFVFWVRADLVNESALQNASQFNATKDAEPSIITDKVYYDVGGSLHYTTRREQNEDETFEKNNVVFTSKYKVEEFNEIGQNVMLIAEFDGIRFSFSSRKPLYLQADIYHYVGDAIYPALASQIIDDMTQFDIEGQIVSNSLPIWLSLHQIMPVYPSYLSDNNLLPPYATVHIEPRTTEAIQGAPFLDDAMNHYQLCKERVTVTVYGLRNNAAIDYLDYIHQYTLSDSASLGVMNMPVIRDEKRVQTEMAVIAQKKTIDFLVDYNQFRARDIARQMILSSFVTDVISG